MGLPGNTSEDTTSGDGGARAPDAGPPVRLDGLPAAGETLALLRLVNEHFRTNWPDPTVDIVTDRARPSNLWTRAVYFEGLMALYDAETDVDLERSYYEYAVRWGESPSHPWQVTYGAVTTIDADAHACGQTYLQLYAVEPDAVRIAQLDASIRSLMSSGNTTAWWWVDALQMAMPVFAGLGQLHDDPSYFDAMWRLYSHARNVEGGGLYNSSVGLWWRDETFTPGGVYIRTPSGRDIYWSRGNGWVMAALLRVLDRLPLNDPHRAEYEADFKALAAALLPLQREDGFWNTSLLDERHCASAGEPGEDGPETSGTALFTYGLAWGIRHGLLDAGAYAAPLMRAWAMMASRAVRADGFLGWVQPTGAGPCSGPGPLAADVAPNFDDFGVGCFLLAGTEVMRLAQ